MLTAVLSLKKNTTPKNGAEGDVLGQTILAQKRHNFFSPW